MAVLMCRYVEETARGKAMEVASRLEAKQDWAVVVGADTVVVRVVTMPISVNYDL